MKEWFIKLRGRYKALIHVGMSIMIFIILPLLESYADIISLLWLAAIIFEIIFIVWHIKYKNNKNVPNMSKKKEEATNGGYLVNLKEKYKNIISTSKDVVAINQYYEQFEKNENLITICKNYVKNIKKSIWVLEFCFVPLSYNTIFSKNYRYRLNTKRIYKTSSNFLQQISIYKQNIIDANIDNVKYAYTILSNQGYYDIANKNYCVKGEKGLIIDPYSDSNLINTVFNDNMEIYPNSYLEVQEELNGIKSLFVSLINQKVLSCENDIHSYFAFLYMLYRYRKMDYFNNAKTKIENAGLSIDDDENKIITKLFENDIDNGPIITALWSTNSHKHAYNDLMSQTYYQYKSKVDIVIETLKEKQKINNLLKNDINKNKFSLADIDLMSGAEFESFVTYLFNQLGYKAANTKLSGDQGIDVIATKGNTKVAIQCKCFHGSVGNHAVMEAFAGAKYYNADKCIVVTNSTFTKSARELASKNGVVLWDRQMLKEKLEEI